MFIYDVCMHVYIYIYMLYMTYIIYIYRYMWFQQQHNESNIYRPFEGNEPQSTDAILGEI